MTSYHSLFFMGERMEARQQERGHTPEGVEQLLADALKDHSKCIHRISVDGGSIIVELDMLDSSPEKAASTTLTAPDRKGNINFVSLSPRQHIAWLIGQTILTNYGNMTVYIRDTHGRAVLPSALIQQMEI